MGSVHLVNYEKRGTMVKFLKRGRRRSCFRLICRPQVVMVESLDEVTRDFPYVHRHIHKRGNGTSCSRWKYPDLPEVAGMVLVEEDAVVVHAAGVSPPARMLGFFHIQPWPVLRWRPFFLFFLNGVVLFPSDLAPSVKLRKSTSLETSL